MSYQDIARNGERELRAVAGGDPGQADNKIVADVFRLQTEVSKLRVEVDKLNGPRDTVELRRRVAATLQRLQASVKAIKVAVEAAHSDHPSQRTTKIVSDFEAVLRAFQGIMKEAKRRETASLPRPSPEAKTAAPPSFQPSQPDVEAAHDRLVHHQQEQAQLLAVNNELAYNEALIEEREQGITEIAQQIGEVSEIFQDLAVLVNDQGMMIDDIESNIVRTAERTQEAGGELLRADRYQRKSRNKMCFILAIVGFVLAILVIVLAA